MITRLQQKPPHTPPPNSRLHKELSWWSRDDGAIVGVVIEDQVDHDFAWVVLERNARCLYNAIDCRASVSTETAALDGLHAAMRTPRHKTLDDTMPGIGSREQLVEALEEVTGVVFARCPNCDAPTVPGRDGMLCDDCHEGLSRVC